MFMHEFICSGGGRFFYVLSTPEFIIKKTVKENGFLDASKAIFKM